MLCAKSICLHFFQICLSLTSLWKYSLLVWNENKTIARSTKPLLPPFVRSGCFYHSNFRQYMRSILIEYTLLCLYERTASLCAYAVLSYYCWCPVLSNIVYIDDFWLCYCGINIRTKTIIIIFSISPQNKLGNVLQSTQLRVKMKRFR